MTHNVEIEGVGNGAAELLAEGDGVELLNVHYGSKILAGEPALAEAAIGFSYVAGVYSRIVLQPFTLQTSALKHWQISRVSSFSTSASKSNGI